MTVGSYSLDSFVNHPDSGSWNGTKGFKSWSGPDQPRVPRGRPEIYTIHREVEDAWTHKLRVVSRKLVVGGPPPKRAQKDEHPYYMQYQRLEQRPVFYPNWGSNVPDMWLLNAFGVYSNWSDTSTLFDANDQIKLVNKLAEQLQGSDFNMSVFLGESSQTLALLADSATRIFRAVMALKRGNVFQSARHLFEGTPRRPKHQHDWRLPSNRGKTGWPSFKEDGSAASGALASKWLELQYGWLPLLKDAEGSAQALAHHLEVPARMTYRAAVRKERYESKSVTFSPTTCGAELGAYRRRGIVARISEPPSVLAKLGLLDPELVAWELMPFSFVADWFIPIGSWMEARAKAGRLVGTFITSDKQVSWVLNPTVNGASPGGAYYSVIFERTVSTTLSVPMPTFKPLEKVASWQHCANAVALVTAAFTGRKPSGNRGY